MQFNQINETTLEVVFNDKVLRVTVTPQVNNICVEIGKTKHFYPYVSYNDPFSFFLEECSDFVASHQRNKKRSEYYIKLWVKRKFKKLFSLHFAKVWRNAHAKETLAMKLDRRCFSVLGKTLLNPEREVLLSLFATNEYFKNDFFNSRACVMVVASVDSIISAHRNIRASDKMVIDYTALGLQAYPSFRVNSDDLQLYGSDYSKIYPAWRLLLSPTFESYSTLNKMLEMIPYPYSSNLLRNLVQTKFTSPPSKLGWFIRLDQRVHAVNAKVIDKATPAQIKKVMKGYKWLIDKEYVTDDSKPRSVARLENVVTYLLDYPNEVQGSVVALFEASKKHHKQLAQAQLQYEANKARYELERSAYKESLIGENQEGYLTPEIELPSDSFRPIRSDAALSNEGRLMGHCIGMYSHQKADYFFYHVTHNGVEATLAILVADLTHKCFGERNTKNEATSYVDQIMTAWRKQMLELRWDKPFLQLEGAPF